MKKFLAFMSLIIIVGCGGNAKVEIGMNDEEAKSRGTPGNLAIWVSKIEIPEDGTTFTTIWEGAKLVEVTINGEDYVSVTDNEIDVAPGSYQNIRLTVDSLYFVTNISSEKILDTTIQFLATAFTAIVVEEGDEMRWVISVMSGNWFDLETYDIKDGHTPFEGAHLKIYHEYR
jgi:hypothetical protein